MSMKVEERGAPRREGRAACAGFEEREAPRGGERRPLGLGEARRLLERQWERYLPSEYYLG